MERFLKGFLKRFLKRVSEKVLEQVQRSFVANAPQDDRKRVLLKIDN
jgi:hypothetical protein